MRLIDADAVIEAVEKNACNTQRIMDAVNNLPSAQPEPRTAYWTKDIVGSVVCSYCGGIREDNRIGHTQWCNCCGCFMRGEEND